MIVGPLIALVIRSIPGAQNQNDLIGGKETCAAAETKAQI